ncbi:MAG: DedA family protein [Fibrobacteres bacterium]|nr:DedA family protein [Fibrobacterota bacterium]
MTEQANIKKVSIIRRSYDWVMHWADTRFGTQALAILAFAESSFFPVPPDVLLIGLNLGKPKKAFYYAFICSLFSVLGGMLGYFIGTMLWQVVSGFFFSYIPGFTPAIFAKVQAMYLEYGFFAVLIAGFTPIPYKVFTIASGVFALNFPLFVLASAISRSLRFFIVSTLIYFFGETIKKYIDKYFNILSFVFVVLIVLGFLLIKLF